MRQWRAWSYRSVMPGWTEELKFDEAFDLHLGHDNYEFGVMSKAARQTIHISHRVGAMVTLLLVGSFALALWRFGSQQHSYRRQALLVSLLLGLAVCVGCIKHLVVIAAAKRGSA